MKEVYQRLKGFKDIIDLEALEFEYIEGKFREVAKVFGYKEIRTPLLENTEVFLRSVGSGSDIVVKKEMYRFEDLGGRDVTIRPEGTAGVVRAYLENGLSSSPIVKLFYIGPMFRAEKPQAGRLRQFHQLGVELIGSADPLADVEVIFLNIYFLKSLGLKNYKLYLNSIGCRKCMPNYIQKLKEYLSERIGKMCEDCQRRYNEGQVLRILDCKVDKAFLEDSPKITDYLCDECKIHFDEVKKHLDMLGIEYVLDHRLVRGLDYYSRTTFEVKVEGLSAQDAISGGGRYDYLVEEFGGKPTPAVGFAIGLERLLLALKNEGWTLPTTFLNQSKPFVLVAFTTKDLKSLAFQFLNKLREKGIPADMYLEERSLKAQMKYADKLGVKFTVIIGPEEAQNNRYTLRDMSTGTQETYYPDDLLDTIKTKFLETL